MKTQIPLRRSRTHKKIVPIKLDDYAARDWGYQNVKNQIRPEFVLGRYKKKSFFPIQKDYARPNLVYSPLNNGYKRELHPGIYSSYTLSQIATVPGAVIVEEKKIRDDKSHQEHRKEVEKKYSELIEKLMNGDLNIEFLLDKKANKRNRTEGKLQNRRNYEENKNNDVQNQKNEKIGKIKVNLRLTSPRNRQKRSKKLGNLK